MDLREKRKNEQVELKEQRKSEVVAAALEVFKTKGIDNAKMTDIAEKAEVGIASVYRYFSTKPELVIQAANEFWRKEISVLQVVFDQDHFNEQNGMEKMKVILEIFLQLYKEHKDFINFIQEFDNYIVKEGISRESLNDYESNILSIKHRVIEALESGKKENMIRKDLDNERFYFSITHSLLSLCEKLALRGNILASDDEVSAEEQIGTMIDMALRYIRK